MFDLEKHLKTHFGYTEFRPYQKEIITGSLNQQDVLAILPTGAGKSVCYQLPALLQPGLTVVISPLISLMQDQVASLFKQQIPAAFLNSSLPYPEIQFVLEHLHTYKLLYVAPERFANPEFIAALQKVSIALVAIDEAHCISQWGHSFRTDYRQLSCLKQHFPKIPIMALTATATRDVEKDIISQLSLQDPLVIRSSFDRPNLTLRIQSKHAAENQLLTFLKNHPHQAGIIYAATRKTTDAMYDLLRKEGFQTEKYHAGLSDSERARAQHAFIYEECPIIVATVAFGMGIHKPDIRFIVHVDMPRSIEQYYQEIGRAGRDGMPSECLMLYAPKEILVYERFAKQIEDPKIRRMTLLKIEKVASLCQSHSCRRKALLHYFGESYKESNCNRCDVCLENAQLVDETLSAQKILSCIYRLEKPFGINHVIDVLRGSKTKTVMEKGHDRLSTFRLMPEYSETHLKELIRALIDQGYLERSSGEYPVLRWTPLSRSAARGEIQVMLHTSSANRSSSTALDKKSKKPPSLKSRKCNRLESDLEPSLLMKTPAPKKNQNRDCDNALFGKLSQLRSKISLDAKIPAFVVFSNHTLIEMAQKFPATEEDLLQIHGVGLAKCQKYGKEFLDAIAAHICGQDQTLPFETDR